MPKSSPVDRTFFSWARQTALMSVPSEPSGHTPKTKTTGSIGNTRDTGHAARGPLHTLAQVTSPEPRAQTGAQRALCLFSLSRSHARLRPGLPGPLQGLARSVAGQARWAPTLGGPFFFVLFLEEGGGFLTMQHKVCQKPCCRTQGLSFVPERQMGS